MSLYLPTHSQGFRNVGLAVTQLRRGLAVAVRDEADNLAIGIAAEELSEPSLQWVFKFADEQKGLKVRLALTAQRARVLNIASRSVVVTIEIAPHIRAYDLATLADPSADLDHPMRGPFRADYEHPTGAVVGIISLCKLARLLPSALVIFGAGHRTQALSKWGQSNGLLGCTADEIDAFPINEARRLKIVTSAQVPLDGAEATRIVAFRPADGGVEHLAIIINDPPRSIPVLTRLHSECFTGDLLSSLKCDCGDQLRGAISEMAAAGGGVLLYVAQEGRGIGLINKLRAYNLQDQGFDTIDANERLGFQPDERVFEPAVEMLRLLGISRVRLMTNNPEKVSALSQSGVEVTEAVRHKFPANAHNEFYLSTKRDRSGHSL
jgi:GTP cyclohydrolase II